MEAKIKDIRLAVLVKVFLFFSSGEVFSQATLAKQSGLKKLDDRVTVGLSLQPFLFELALEYEPTQLSEKSTLLFGFYQNYFALGREQGRSQALVVAYKYYHPSLVYHTFGLSYISSDISALREHNIFVDALAVHYSLQSEFGKGFRMSWFAINLPFKNLTVQVLKDKKTEKYASYLSLFTLKYNFPI